MADEEGGGDSGAGEPAPDAGADAAPRIVYRQYRDETDIPRVMQLVDSVLSEPYSIFTYRYFLSPWPQLCFFAYAEDQPIGVVVGKVEMHKSGRKRGYIGMLVVLNEYRKHGIGRELVKHSIGSMQKEGVEEVVLECETDNAAALRLYDSLGFLRDKCLHRYYLAGTDAYRLKLRLVENAAAVAARVD